MLKPGAAPISTAEDDEYCCMDEALRDMVRRTGGACCGLWEAGEVMMSR